MDNSLFESLLYEGESNTLDFKEGQYEFISATEEQKSELLKDILAFANAWRHDTAYILIGVRAQKIGRAIPVGITEHIDDANLQQFVNKKTNQPIDFKYYSFQYEGKSIGIIELALQKRPLYLLKKFGSLTERTVYLRRGSSTDIAAPDEISNMGASSVKKEISPEINFQFAGIKSRSLQGKAIEIESILLLPPVDGRSIQNHFHRDEIGGKNRIPHIFESNENGNFYTEVVEYELAKNATKNVGFHVQNRGQYPITNLKISAHIDKQQGLCIFDDASFPKEPYFFKIRPRQVFNTGLISVAELPKSYELCLIIDRLLPGEEIWVDDEVFMGGFREMTVTMDTRIFADQLPQPLSEKLIVNIKTKVVQRGFGEWTVVALGYK